MRFHESREATVLVLGVGNLLLTDEGIGVHVADFLEKEGGFPSSVRVVEGGTDGFSLFSVISEADHMVVVDCVKAGGEPGAVYRFTLDDISRFPDIYKTSAHQISLEEVLTLMPLVTKAPRSVVIIGVEPESLEMGMSLSPTVAAKFPKVVELVRLEVDRLLAQTEKA
jgi:hydrogenase maturation protease